MFVATEPLARAIVQCAAYRSYQLPKRQNVSTLSQLQSQMEGAKHPTSIKALLCWSRFVRKLETWLPSAELQFVALMTKFDQSESKLSRK